jgi:hypothetical protein
MSLRSDHVEITETTDKILKFSPLFIAKFSFIFYLWVKFGGFQVRMLENKFILNMKKCNAKSENQENVLS